MPVFLSHSHKDSAIYTTLCIALDAVGIPRWDVREMAIGDPLADQLRMAIRDCEVCIFVATRRSLESPWCLAEVGAFWGSGKRVFLFMADPDLTDSMLPPQFKGNLMVSDAANLFTAAREEIARQATPASGPERETFFESSGDYGTDKDWLQLLHETKFSFDVMGVHLSSWRETNGFSKIVKGLANIGCKFRFMLMDPENQILTSLDYQKDVSKEQVINAIVDNSNYYLELAEAVPNTEVRLLKNGMPHFFCTNTDKHAVLVMYLASQTWGSGPTWKCPTNSPLYRMAAQEFETLWNVATPAVAQSARMALDETNPTKILRGRKKL